MSFLDNRGSDAGAQLAGFAIAVFGSAALSSAGLILLFAAIGGQPPDPLEAIAAFGGLFLGFSLTIALAMIVIGLPLTLLFTRAGLESPTIYPLSGFFAGGALTVLAYLWLLGGAHAPPPDPLVVLIGGVPGGLCGWLWWQFHRARLCRERRER